jgi:hypothetical protein
VGGVRGLPPEESEGDIRQSAVLFVLLLMISFFFLSFPKVNKLASSFKDSDVTILVRAMSESVNGWTHHSAAAILRDERAQASWGDLAT